MFHTPFIAKIKTITGLTVLVLTMFMSVPALTPSASACGKESTLGIPTWHKYLDGPAGECRIFGQGEFPENAQESAKNVGAIGIALLEIAATLGAVVALIMVFWGAFNFLLSRGESDKAASARRTVQNAAIGLVLLLVSTQVISFIGNTVT